MTPLRHPGRSLFRLLLAVPALAMLVAQLHGTLAMDLLEPSGEMAVRLMIAAMLPGPLTARFGAPALLRLWLSVRRDFGLAAFAYALLHLGYYAADSGVLSVMLDEFALPSIWTGWVALALLLPPASISSDRAMRALGRHWKLIQRLVYPALLATIVHWLLLAWNWLPALLHLAPLLLAWLLRLETGWRPTPARRPS